PSCLCHACLHFFGLPNDSAKCAGSSPACRSAACKLSTANIMHVSSQFGTLRNVLMPGLLAQVAVIIPTLDEQDSIVQVVNAIPPGLAQHIIVADGGSRDETISRARSAGGEVIESGRGYGRACLSGSQFA